MKSSMAAFFSYLFITSVIALIISAFGAVIVGIRHLLTTISDTEQTIGYYFLLLFIASLVLAPLFLHLNQKFDRLDRRYDDDF